MGAPGRRRRRPPTDVGERVFMRRWRAGSDQRVPRPDRRLRTSPKFGIPSRYSNKRERAGPDATATMDEAPRTAPPPAVPRRDFRRRDEGRRPASRNEHFGLSAHVFRPPPRVSDVGTALGSAHNDINQSYGVSERLIEPNALFRNHYHNGIKRNKKFWWRPEKCAVKLNNAKVNIKES